MHFATFNARSHQDYELAANSNSDSASNDEQQNGSLPSGGAKAEKRASLQPFMSLLEVMKYV
jgi:hypothetical protein